MKWFITGDTHGKVYNRIITSDFGMTHNAALIIWVTRDLTSI